MSKGKGHIFSVATTSTFSCTSWFIDALSFACFLNSPSVASCILICFTDTQFGFVRPFSSTSTMPCPCPVDVWLFLSCVNCSVKTSKETQAASETQCFYVLGILWVLSTWIEDFSWRNHLWSTLRSLATWPEENVIQIRKKSSNATEVSLLFLYHACGLLPCGRNTGTCRALVKPVLCQQFFGPVNIAVDLQLFRGKPGWYRARVSSCSTRLFWGIDNRVVFAMWWCSTSTLSLQRVSGK